MEPIRTDFKGYEGQFVAMDARTGVIVIADKDPRVVLEKGDGSQLVDEIRHRRIAPRQGRAPTAPPRRLSSEAMVTQLSDVMATASLTPAERSVVERLVERLCDELGSDLHAIWLYGSRARGETPHPESDIDLMVLANGSSWRTNMKAIELLNPIALAEGVSPVWFSFFVETPEWLRGRREIRSFFIAEVDRDRIVLYGSGLE
jgi:predicted nucleotidyltransferase